MPASSTTRSSVADLCAKHANEDLHANQVTALALQLFDATSQLVGAPPGDRPLLEAACRLHDLGYRAHPRRHAERGSEIVRQEGLTGFTDAQRDDIAAAVLLHATGLKTVAAASRRPRPSDSRRPLRLAAYLRIADGLDHAHVQDATIVAVRPGPRAIRVSVRCRHSPRNLEVARRKSDVWRAVFPVSLRLMLAPRRTSRPAPLLERDLSVVEAARRLLFLYFRELLAQVEGAVEAKDIEALHDLRVAIRRIRAVLRAFRKPLAGTAAPRLDRELQNLNSALGEVRDLDVWIDYLTTGAVQAQLGGHPRWTGFVGHQSELRRLQQTTIRRRLLGASFAALRDRIGRFLRIELPRLVGNEPGGALEELGRRVLAKHLRRVAKLADLRQARSAEKLHRLRIALRRARHVGGFFAGLLGPPVVELGKRLQAVEWALGRIRDVDLALARIQREGPAPPRRLVARLENRRREARVVIAKAWQRLEESTFLAEPSLLKTHKTN